MPRSGRTSNRYRGNEVSFKAEVIADGTGNWCGNALRFATQAEAEAYVSDLMWRWTAVRNTRVIVVNDPVTAEWKDGRLVNLKVSNPVQL
jgi:hypothetical protein